MSRQDLKELCRDIVCQAGKVFSHDRVGQARILSIATEYFDVTIELAKVRRNYFMTKQFYVSTKLARIGRISVATKESLSPTTELCSHNRHVRATGLHARHSYACDSGILSR